MSGTVQLQKPGAGIPFLERWVTRLYFLPKNAREMTWDTAVQWFLKEGDKILSTIGPLSVEQMEKPVLVERVLGMEDSSRFWSAAMTVEHLMIVGDAMSRAIVELTHGREPKYDPDIIVKVKPPRNLPGKDAADAFKKFLTVASNRVMGEVGERDSRARLAHPWFGRLTARQWNWLMPAHQRLHRMQIERIIKGL